MKVLLTGVTGYIGKRLLSKLIEQGHFVYCLVRDKSRFEILESYSNRVDVIECDLLDRSSLTHIPLDIDVSFYLVHSMSNSKDYGRLELQSAQNFRLELNKTNVKQVIYLGGITNEEELSEHLTSRKNVEKELSTDANYSVTTLKAGIIIGSGSASFEIIRDLVEKLPVMITPKWLNTKCQPIAIANVLDALIAVMGRREFFNISSDIGGPDVLSYKQMLLIFAEVRSLKRSILTIPIMTPKLSSYWLYFVTSTSYRLANALVSSMKIEVVCKDNLLDQLSINKISYKDGLKRAFRKIEANEIVSSWKDSYVSGVQYLKINDFINVPRFGCFKDVRSKTIIDKSFTINKIWGIGGQNGWYFGNILWRFRGFLDKVVGGVGLRRGRKSLYNLEVGDAVDFWRVLYANKETGRLLLFAEMKVPGEAWLEFNIKNGTLQQTATFRPKGLLGRLYWYSVLPFHGIVFKGMINKLVS